jgi:hypothetical protein
MRMVGYALLYAALLALVVAWNAGAHAGKEDPNVAHFGSSAHTYAATLRCAHIAEDSAAHVRLARYDVAPDGTRTIVYVCERHGY